MKMKVLFISEYFPPNVKGGGEISCFLLAKYLVKEGIEVHVLTSKFKNKQKKEIVKGIFVHRSLNTGENPTSVLSNVKRNLVFPRSVKKETKSLLKKHKFNIIHYFNTNSAQGVIKTKIPKIMHINSPVTFCPKGDLLYNGREQCQKYCSYDVFEKCFVNSNYLGKMVNYPFLKHNPLFRKYLYSAYKKRINNLKNFDLCIPISNFLASRLEIIKINKDKIKIVPNIVETKNFEKSNENKKELKIVYLGSYTKFKGLIILLKALEKLNRKYTCNLYGSGNLENKIKEIVKSKKLNVKINPEVKYSEIPKILSKHNILVFPSIIPEAFGRVLIEAMAAGCFPISSEIGGTVDIIKNKKEGILFKPGNYIELNKILEKINLDKINKNHLVKEAKKYNGENISKQMKKIYEELIKK